ncbi:Uncharacterized protein TCAP_00478, partial [Tolypocladium capitatum]
TKQLRTALPSQKVAVVAAPSSSHIPPHDAHSHPDNYDSLARVEVVTMADQVQELLDTPNQFLRDGVQFVKKCQKPDGKEFAKICQAVGTGFVIMGVVGYIVKLIHIPINQILVGGA